MFPMVKIGTNQNYYRIPLPGVCTILCQGILGGFPVFLHKVTQTCQ